MTDQQHDHHDRDDEGGMGQTTGTDWTMGQGDTGTDAASSQSGDSADNDGGTSGDYVSGDSTDERSPGG